MKLHAAALLIAFLAALGVVSPAADDQTQARNLLERARKLSDIRSPQAPAFRLKATFAVASADLNIVEGTYTEIWISNSQWRRETVLGPSRRIEVGGATKRWLVESGPPLPKEVQHFSSVLDLTPSWWNEFTFEPPTDHEVKGSSVRCALTAGETGERNALCFYVDSGLLLQVVTPKKIGVRYANYSCQYGDYQRFGEYVFPRALACFQDSHRKLKADIVELSPDSSHDPALFSPPAGATELENSVDHPTPPKFLPDPRFPF